MKETKAKILLVDDRPENLFALERVVKGDDRELFKADSGEEALKLNLEHEFALILSDVQMPGMDGFEMLEILRMDEHGAQIPVIFLTALSKEDHYVHKGYSEGAVDYLFKPLNPSIVRAKVDVFVSLYKQRVKLEKQAELLEKMNQDKNKFLGMAAHDLRNPIGVIEHYSKFLIEDMSESVSHESLSFLEIIKTSSHQMNRLVSELLDVSQIESGVFELVREPSQLNDVIENAIVMNSVFAQRKDIRLETELDRGLPVSSLDPGKMWQVLNNLISNAIKYSPKGTSISIRSWLETNHLTISVKDEGLGIDAKDIPTLFDAFTVTSNKATAGETSTGLGLMITSKIVKAHEGIIDVESTKGIGSTFTVKIPLCSIESDVSSIRDKDGLEIITCPELRVLLTDDNPMIREVSKMIFNSFGVQVVTAEDGGEALEKFRKAEMDGTPFDIVFTDLNMPVKDGYQLTEAIRMGYGKDELPIIGLSASINPEVIENCKSYGMNSWAEKPVNKKFVQEMFTTFIQNTGDVKISA